MKIFLTGFTGNVGRALAEAFRDHEVLALVRDPRRITSAWPGDVEMVVGSLDALPQSRAEEIDVIIHSAADTSFRTPLDEIRKTNVAGTQSMLDFAARCPRLRRFIHVSTVCVSGTSTGPIAESPSPQAPGFVNNYEQSKWEAEQIVLMANLPVEIVRLSIVVGSDDDGSTVKIGALHQAVFWLWRGLIPLLPGNAATPIDLISTEYAACVVRAVFESPLKRGRIVHAAAGQAAPSLGDVLDLTFDIFTRHHPAWRRGAIARPVLADGRTWGLFAAAAERSGDALYQRIVGDAQSFLPGLLYTRTYATDFARRSVPTPSWSSVVEHAIEHLIQTNWHRPQTL